ncbi:hypothetical protein JST97_18345 [bacterium]|nr:hypothetical protein [bacterium]
MRFSSGLIALNLVVSTCLPARADLIDDLGAEASRLRQLSYRKVPNKRVNQNFISSYVGKEVDKELKGPAVRRRELFLKDFKLMKPAASLAGTYKTLLKDQVRGLYDPDTKSYLVVKGGSSAGIERMLMNMYSFMGLQFENVLTVHELDHAIQDQHFNLKKLQKSVEGNWDRELALQSLVEGDASSVMTDYLFQQMGQPRPTSVDIPPVTGSPVVDSAPIYFRDGLIVPYLQGQAFVDYLRQSGGWPAVDRAYLKLPASSEQILHPKKYFNDPPRPVKINLPGLPGYQNLGQDTAGEFVIRCWGRENNLWRGLASGWGGDRFQTWASPTDHYTLWESHWDTAQDAKEFADFARPRLSAKDNLLQEQNRVQIWLNIPPKLIKDRSRFL